MWRSQEPLLEARNRSRSARETRGEEAHTESSSKSFGARTATHSVLWLSAASQGLFGFLHFFLLLLNAME